MFFLYNKLINFQYLLAQYWYSFVVGSVVISSSGAFSMGFFRLMKDSPSHYSWKVETCERTNFQKGYVGPVSENPSYNSFPSGGLTPLACTQLLNQSNTHTSGKWPYNDFHLHSDLLCKHSGGLAYIF